MPRCEGTPDNDCPFNRSGQQVSLCQCDLMLCCHCNSIRFPNTYHPQGLPTQKQCMNGASTERNEFADQDNVECVKDLTELKTVSEDRYLELFLNSLDMIFHYSSLDIQNSISSVPLDLL